MRVPFDKIYCLHLLENTERYSLSQENFKKVGFPEDKIEYWYNVKTPSLYETFKNIESLHTEGYDYIRDTYNPDLYAGVFGCSYGHYNIIKTAYLRGFESILVCEDDILFNDDIDLIQRTFDNIPEDWDVLKYYISASIGYKDVYETEEYPSKSYYINKNDHSYCWAFSQGNVMYAINRKAMKAYIDYVDKNFIVCDLVWKEICDGLNCYIPRYQIGYINDGSIKSNVLSFNK